MTPRESGVLFNGEMVRAILDGLDDALPGRGQKWQTRRPAKFAMDQGEHAHAVHAARDSGWVAWWGRHGSEANTKTLYSHGVEHPHGRPGDRLWVRETWRLADINALREGSRFITVQFKEGFGVLPYRPDWSTHYAELVAKEPWAELGGTGIRWGKWRPSIHMPRWASRITLEVTGRRVERVQDISEEDARAEGCGVSLVDRMRDCSLDDRREFENLWDSIYASKGFGWDVNPWVWVTEFRVVEVRR